MVAVDDEGFVLRVVELDAFLVFEIVVVVVGLGLTLRLVVVLLVVVARGVADVVEKKVDFVAHEHMLET